MVVFGCIVAAIPPVAMYLLSRNHAVVSEQRHLALAAENSILHADSLIQDIAYSFYICSPENREKIEEMQNAVESILKLDINDVAPEKSIVP